jgi:hypothetical protein
LSRAIRTAARTIFACHFASVRAVGMRFVPSGVAPWHGQPIASDFVQFLHEIGTLEFKVEVMVPIASELEEIGFANSTGGFMNGVC